MSASLTTVGLGAVTELGFVEAEFNIGRLEVWHFSKRRVGAEGPHKFFL